jgi:hypothetical protein
MQLYSRQKARAAAATVRAIMPATGPRGQAAPEIQVGADAGPREEERGRTMQWDLVRDVEFMVDSEKAAT